MTNWPDEKRLLHFLVRKLKRSLGEKKIVTDNLEIPEEKNSITHRYRGSLLLEKKIFKTPHMMSVTNHKQGPTRKKTPEENWLIFTWLFGMSDKMQVEKKKWWPPKKRVLPRWGQVCKQHLSDFWDATPSKDENPTKHEKLKKNIKCQFAFPIFSFGSKKFVKRIDSRYSFILKETSELKHLTNLLVPEKIPPTTGIKAVFRKLEFFHVRFAYDHTNNYDKCCLIN